MKAYPTLAKIDLSATERVLATGVQTLYKFSVKANGGDVYLYKFAFTVSSSTGSASANTALSLGEFSAYTDSAYSLPDTTFSPTGLLNYGNRIDEAGGTTIAKAGTKTLGIYFSKTSATLATTTYKVPSGENRYFVLKATAATVESTDSTSEYINVALLGDAAYSVNAATLMETAAGLDVAADSDFVWSPNSTSSSNAITDLDFTNGYSILGLPSPNMSTETLTSK